MRTEFSLFLDPKANLYIYRILLLLLIRSYDLCDETFYNDDDKKMQKTKNQSIQTDPRPKLIPWENSCRFCNTQMHATKECRTLREISGFTNQSFFVKIVFTKNVKVVMKIMVVAFILWKSVYSNCKERY